MRADTNDRTARTPVDRCLLARVSTAVTSIAATGVKFPRCLLTSNGEVSALRQHAEVSPLWPSKLEGQLRSGTSRGSSLDREEHS